MLYIHRLISHIEHGWVRTMQTTRRLLSKCIRKWLLVMTMPFHFHPFLE